MLGARGLILIGLLSAAITTQGAAQSLFNLPFNLPGAAPPPNPQTYLPPDADPNYSTPGGFDEDVDMSRTTRREVRDPTGEPAGTLTINTHERKLYLSLGDGRALQYGIGVGRAGLRLEGKGRDWPQGVLARMDAAAGNAGAAAGPAGASGRGHGESARRARPLPV